MYYNKLLFITILILTLSFSSAYASIDYNLILQKLQDLNNIGVITGLPTDYNSNGAWGTVKDRCNMNDCIGYFIGITGNNGGYYDNSVVIIPFRTYYGTYTDVITNSTGADKTEWSQSGGVFHNDMSSWVSGGIKNNNVSWVYGYTYNISINTTSLVLGKNEEFGDFGPSFDFEPYDINGYINVYASGETENFIRRPFSYTVNSTRLGYITNIDDYYYLEGKFGPFVNSNTVDSSYGFIKNQVGTYNGQLSININGEVTINSNKLVNNQGYALYFKYKLSPDADYTYSDYYYYYTYKYGTNPSSGDVVSSELDSNLDIGMVNALDDYFNYTSGDSDNIDYILGTEVFNFAFSGDILSGDLVSGEIIDKLGFNDYTKNNRYSLLIYNTYKNILSTLNSSDLNSSISFSLHGVNYTFNSSQFALPSGPIKTLVSTFVYVLLIGCFIRFMHNLYLKLSIFDIHGYISSFDSDHSIFM